MIKSLEFSGIAGIERQSHHLPCPEDQADVVYHLRKSELEKPRMDAEDNSGKR
jgi:hypothetical protein